MRNGVRARMIDNGNIVKIDSSKSSVKSNPLRHCGPAQGPNVLSTDTQFCDARTAIVRNIKQQSVTTEYAQGVQQVLKETTRS